MASRSTLVSEIRRLLTGEDADPRALQGVFLVPLLLDLVFRLVLAADLDRYLVIGWCIVAVPTATSLALHRRPARDRWMISLPVLDIVALGVLWLSAGSAVGIAVVVPAIWLGLQFGRRGVWVTALSTLASFVLPRLATVGFAEGSLSAVIQLTLMAGFCAGAVAMTAELWKAQVDQTRKNATSLEHALADISEQRRLTRTIVNGVDVGLVSIDSTGTYDSINPRHREFLNLAFPEGHTGRAGQRGFVYAADGVTLMNIDDMPTVRASRGEAFRDCLIWVGEDPATRRGLAVSSTPYFLGNGQFGGAVLAYHDITELVVASRIKDEFVASVSHELRTPLTSIIGYVDLVLDDAEDLPPDATDFLVTVQRNARRLHRLVDDLLSTALQSVTTVLDVVTLSVPELVRRSAIEASRAAGAARLSFEFDTSGVDGSLEILGDPERLAQVFDNLFSNAIKYTPAGGHVVGSVVREDRHAVIRVRDTGRGISETELGEIFNKFFRSRSLFADGIPGIGLGLAITKTIVDAHGGQINVSSTLGEGTTFEVRFPLADAQPLTES